jgi:hypothetical protein
MRMVEIPVRGVKVIAAWPAAGMRRAAGGAILTQPRLSFTVRRARMGLARQHVDKPDFDGGWRMAEVLKLEEKGV